MIITLKTLEQKTFKIEIDETEKIKALKEKIAEERGCNFPVAGQKLIYSGKILDDEKLISEYNIDPVKNFVVVMVVKAKTKPKSSEACTSQTASSETATSSTKETTEAACTTIASETCSQSTTTTTASTPCEITTTETTATQNTTAIAESTLLTGNDLETSILELMALGYSREQVMRALNKSFHNADRAAEYLLAGDAEDTEDVCTQEVTAPTTEAADGDLSFLRSLPQFQLMRRQLQSDPNTLPLLLQQIGQTNPQLLSLISQNQEAFINLLNETGTSEAEPASAPAESGAQGGGSGGGGAFQIQVTPSEKEAIDRIVSMGFDEPDVIQAYFACEKNEELTVDFLLLN